MAASEAAIQSCKAPSGFGCPASARAQRGYKRTLTLRRYPTADRCSIMVRPL